MKKLVLPNYVLLGEVERLLKNGTTVTLRTKGNSMLPFIVGERDSVILVSYSELPKAGDIALAHLPDGAYVLHRILSVGNNGKIELMGDGNLRGTEKCMTDDLCGKATFIIRNGKRLKTSSWYFVFISRLWRVLLPVRRILLSVYRRVFMKIL